MNFDLRKEHKSHWEFPNRYESSNSTFFTRKLINIERVVMKNFHSTNTDGSYEFGLYRLNVFEIL